MSMAQIFYQLLYRHAVLALFKDSRRECHSKKTPCRILYTYKQKTKKPSFLTGTKMCFISFPVNIL